MGTQTLWRTSDVLSTGEDISTALTNVAYQRRGRCCRTARQLAARTANAAAIRPAKMRRGRIGRAVSSTQRALGRGVNKAGRVVGLSTVLERLPPWTRRGLSRELGRRSSPLAVIFLLRIPRVETRRRLRCQERGLSFQAAPRGLPAQLRAVGASATAALGHDIGVVTQRPGAPRLPEEPVVQAKPLEIKSGFDATKPSKRSLSIVARGMHARSQALARSSCTHACNRYPGERHRLGQPTVATRIRLSRRSCRTGKSSRPPAT